MNLNFFKSVSAPQSLYIHIPFCHSKCSYCDFFSCAFSNMAELNKFSDGLYFFLNKILENLNTTEIKTIYLGGGNPGILGIDNLSKILKTIADHIPDNQILECTIEINPENITLEMLEFLNSTLVSRLSVGVQTFDKRLHKVLGRNSSVDATVKALHLIKNNWKGSWNSDLIYGIPHQVLENVKSDMKSLLSYNPDHISLYSLIPEPETVLGKKVISGELIMPADEDIIAFEKYQRNFLDSYRYNHYEISNFSLKNKQSLHNINYWNMNSYIGVGPGAVSTVKTHNNEIQRLVWSSDLDAFRKNELKIEQTIINSSDFLKDWLMMNLRKTTGFLSSDFTHVFNMDFLEVFSEESEKYIKLDCLGINKGRIFLTDKGSDLFNDVLSTCFMKIDQLNFNGDIVWP